MRIIGSKYKTYHKIKKGTKPFKRAKSWKKKVKLKVETKPERIPLKEFAQQLEENLPKSEQWFRELYEQYKHENDEFNKPFYRQIPDLINKKLKYIIEIDGSFHDNLRVKCKDLNKDYKNANRGYVTLRIKAYDKVSFDIKMKILHAIRTDKEKHKDFLKHLLTS